jgi:hypothetical protein
LFKQGIFVAILNMPEINADIRVNMSMKNAEFEQNLTVTTFCLNAA